MRQLTEAVTRAASGRGRVYFLAGQAGIGKTRLAREALASARQQGFQMLEGHAYPFERSLAYGLILDAFGPRLRNLDPVRRSALVNGLDDLGRLFSTLGLPTPEPLGDPALEKTRLFEAVARLLDRLVRAAPAVLFLDDLHWADPASLELLHYLGRGIAEQPLLLLATYRDDEADAARGLRALLNSLQRSGLAQLLTVPRLEPKAVEELAQGILGAEAPGELLAILAARAGGTPLFIEGLIRAFIDSGQLARTGDRWAFNPGPSAALPPALRDLILERLERLAPADRHLLNLIAVSGDAAPHSLLRAASDQSEETLLAGLSRLMAAGLVVEDHDGPDVAYGLSQALIQEVAYAELPEMARRQAHAAFVAALEALRPDDLDRLARHYRGAGPLADQDRALEVLLAAADRARGLYANNEAAQHFGAALALVRLGRRAELLPALLERLGEAWEQLGEGVAAIAVWAEAEAEFERLGDVDGVARLHRRLAMAEWDRGHFAVAQAHLSAGLEALAGHEPTQELADVLHARVVLLGRLDDSRAFEAAASELLDIANQLALPRARVEAHLAQGGSRLQRGEYATAREHALRGLSAAEAAGELLLAHRAYDLLALVAWVLGDHRLSRAHSEHSLALAQRLGAPTLELLPNTRLVAADLMAGNWDQARRRSGAALASARRGIGQPRAAVSLLATRAMIFAQQGDLDEADACIAEARRVFGVESGRDRHAFAVVDLAEAIIALERGDAARALALTAVPGSSLVHRFPIGMALVAEAQAASGEAEPALQAAHELAGFGRPDNVFAAALAARAEGLAQHARGDVKSATACLARAADGFAHLEMPFEAARARAEWAALVAGADALVAASAAQESLAVFERLGAQRYARRARQTLHRLGIHPPAARRATPGQGSLSARELQVARLVAEGRSNAEIAERLVISPRTVTTHLNRMYARLGINSRAALARYVAEAGLLPPAGQNT